MSTAAHRKIAVLKTISFKVSFFFYSELKAVKPRSTGPGHGYWAHLRRGEADISSQSYSHFFFRFTHTFTLQDTHTTHPTSHRTFTFAKKKKFLSFQATQNIDQIYHGPSKISSI